MIVAVMVRETWTDERLDDLSAKVDQGFADTKAEMRGGFTRVDTLIRELRNEMNARFDAMNRNFIAGLIAVIAAIVGSNAALAVALLGS
jgi:phage-related protein